MHPNPRKILPIFLLILIAASLVWYFSSQSARAETGRLAASGTIEATQVDVAPELSGRILEVRVREGDAVRSGELLIRFEDSLLQAQLAQAQANLAQAQANYDLVAAGLPPEQRQANIHAAQLELVSAQQALDDLYTTHALQLAQAQQEVAVADKALDQANQVWDNLRSQADQADIDAAWASVVLAKDRLDKAREDFKPYEKKPADDVKRAIFQTKLAAAQKQYDNLLTRYNNLVGRSNKYDLAVAEANVVLARARLDDARRRYADLQDGPDPRALELATARLEAAKARLAAAQADPSAEQLALAKAQVEVAQAALKAIQVQLAKLALASPVDGFVLYRSVEAGEVVMAGAPLLTIGRLDELKLIVYIPEERYGAIRLEQTARVTVDSFPGETFQARVVRIADKAEFTPRNVQTEAGRRTTVFAIELALQNPQGKLKPGMPADVEFGG